MKYVSILFIFLITACTAVRSASDEERLGETAWNLVAVEQRPVNYDGRAFIKFDEKERKISGKAVCNSYFADYEMIGQKITFSPVGSTKMYCEGVMDAENAIITNLQRTTRYEVKADFLYLYSDNLLVLTFKR